MVYIHSWQEFQDAAEALYTESPDKARYCVKWKSSEGKGKLVLKVTDNTSCIKFKTDSSSFLNRIEALNSSLLEKIQNKQRREQPPPEPAAASEGGPKSETPNPLPAGTSSAVPTQIPSGAGVKKKKPKKRK